MMVAAIFLGLAWAAPLRPAARRPSRPQTTRSHRVTSRRVSHRIAPTRVRQIQRALIKAGYLEHADGIWGPKTEAAMQRYQKDHHWQTRYAPDARALIALGLGPAQDPVPGKAPASGSAAGQTPLPPAEARPPAARGAEAQQAASAAPPGSVPGADAPQ